MKFEDKMELFLRTRTTIPADQIRSHLIIAIASREETLAELSFVREALEKICHVGIITCDDCERAVQIAVATLSRLDALTGDGE